MIGHLADPSDRIMLGLVGFRIYSSNSIGFGKPGGHTFNFSSFGKIVGTNEVYKPADKITENGNVEFLKKLTNDFYKRASGEFSKIINEHIPNTFVGDHPTTGEGGVGEDPTTGEGEVGFKDLGIVDGTGPFSKSLRSPFNMSLYYFPKDTYMGLNEKEEKSINPLPSDPTALLPPPPTAPALPLPPKVGGKSLKKYKTPHRSYNFSKSKSVIRNNTRKKRKSKKPNK